jgi:phosphatidylserine decarboxylase
VQIAGLIARRIICDLTDGQEIVGGDRFGLIRFGSRTDVYLPEGSVVAVQVGDHVAGGESVIAHLPSVAL